jgi:hypothetical protein
MAHYMKNEKTWEAPHLISWSKQWVPYIGQGRFVRGSNALEMPFKIKENIKSLKSFSNCLCTTR